MRSRVRRSADRWVSDKDKKTMIAADRKSLLLVATLAFAALCMTAVNAQGAEEDAGKSVELRLEGACDPKNSKLYIVNNHASRSVIVTVRWNLSGSKRIITEQFQLAPVAKLQVGCAAQADIVVAAFAP